MIKRILAGALSLTMALSFASCGDSKDEEKNSASDSSSAAAVTEPTEESEAESSGEDISVGDSSESETADSADGETDAAESEYTLTYAVPATEMTYERPSYYEYDFHASKDLHEYSAPDDDNTDFYTITDMCSEDNGLEVNADDPDSWFESIKDQFATNINKKIISDDFYSDGGLVLNSEEQVEINGRIFIKFDITVPNTLSDQDMTALGYLTVIKDENIEGYENGNTVGFLITDYNGTADKAMMEEYLQHAAETLVVA